ncbi:hypothetical protein L9F63_015345, partial [Diploptera punctata]
MKSKVFISEEGSNRQQIQHFYSIIRPTALICKILGTFNIKNSFSNDGRCLQYRLLSLDTLWSSIMYITIAYLVWKYETFPWWITLAPVETYRNISMLFLCIYYDKFLLDLIRHFEDYDILYYIKCKHAPTKSFFGSGTIWMLIALFLISTSLAQSFSMVNVDPNRSIPRTLADCIIVVFPWISSQSLFILYILLCVNISSRFRDIHSLSKNVVANITAEKLFESWKLVNENKEKIEDGLEKIRILFNHLSEIIIKLNKCYGMKLANHMMMCFVQMLLDAYQHIYNFGIKPNQLILFLCYQAFIVLIIAAITENVTTNVSIF